MPDRGFLVEVLKMVLFVRDDHVDVVGASQTMVGDRQKAFASGGR
jgi:hypothetical protein